MKNLKYLLIFTLLLCIPYAIWCVDKEPKISDLLIDLSVFPKGWSVSQTGPKRVSSAPLGGRRSIQSIGIDFYTYGGGAVEEILMFENSKIAAQEYQRQKENNFRETQFDSLWITPDDLKIEDLGSDRFFYSCSKSIGSPWPGCAYIAQYGTYVVYFHTGMYPDSMNYTDFERIIAAIDEKFTIQAGNR